MQYRAAFKAMCAELGAGHAHKRLAYSVLEEPRLASARTASFGHTMDRVVVDIPPRQRLTHVKAAFV